MILAIMRGGAISSFPLLLAWVRPGAVVTRQVIAVAQMLWSALLIHLSGGRIETHFHVFGSLAFLGFYRDWTVLPTATVVVVVDHLLRQLYWPESVYGVTNPESWRFLEHAFWVLFENFFLILAGLQNIQEMREIALRQAQVEALSASEHQTSEALKMSLAQQQTLQVQILQSQKMEAVGRLAGGVAHDFNNMLTVIKGHLELLLQQVGPVSPLHESLSEIQSAADRSAQLTAQLLTFSRQQVLKPVRFDLNNAVTEVDSLLRRLIGEDVEVKLSLAPELHPVSADPIQVQQALLNLVVNARDAMPQGGVLTIETAEVELDEVAVSPHASSPAGRYVMLAVSDTGHGMDHATQARVFDPFFTTKERGKGTGLGLSMVDGIVSQSRGHIRITSQPGRGTTVRIYLPALSADATCLPRPASVAARSVGSETILLVEDEDSVRRMVGSILKRQGYVVLSASGGEEALRIARSHRGPIHLLLSDFGHAADGRAGRLSGASDPFPRPSRAIHVRVHRRRH